MAYLSEWGIPIFRIDPGPTGLDAYGGFITGLPIDVETTLSPADILAIADAVWAHLEALTVAKFLGLK